MKFNKWHPKNNPRYVRFYFAETNKEGFISVENGQVKINAQIHDQAEISVFLTSSGIDFFSISSTAELENELEGKGLIANQSKSYKRTENSQQGFKNASLSELFKSSNMLNPASAPFKDSTRKNAVVLVDHREPDKLYQNLRDTALNVQRAGLKSGDILIYSEENPSSKLLIERKTITDFYNSIMNAHAHEQAERYFKLQMEAESIGDSLQVIWIIEGEESGQRTLYNTLPEIKQTDGMVNYLVTILEQHVVTSYSTVHTAYLVAKFIQGHIEKSLYYPVKKGALRVDVSGKERKNLKARSAKNNSGHQTNESRGLIQASNGLADLLSLFPNIPTNVAKELAGTGKSLSQIACMSKTDLMRIKGVAELTAQRIYNDFNQKG